MKNSSYSGEVNRSINELTYIAIGKALVTKRAKEIVQREELPLSIAMSMASTELYEELCKEG